MKTHSTNYNNALIEVAADSIIAKGTKPPSNSEILSVASIQYELMSKHPYEYTSDDVVFLTFAYKNDLLEREMEGVRSQFFSKGQPCLRCSPLCKRYGWGIHHNQEGKIALVDVGSEKYQQLIADPTIEKIKAMRTSRKK